MDKTTSSSTNSTTASGSGIGGKKKKKNLRPDGRKNHDELRRFQVTQPLRPVVSKWPLKMTDDQKLIFKAHNQAVRLLVQLGYANGTDW